MANGNGWGGHRAGSGRKPKRPGTSNYKPRNGAPAERPAPRPVPWANIATGFLGGSRSRGHVPHENPFRIDPAMHPPDAIPQKFKLAMDDSINWAAAQWSGGVMSNVVSEGLLFLGYPFLSELAQRPEYRVISETIATEMTRKWIKFSSVSEEEDKTSKIKELTDFLDSLRIRDVFSDTALNDGFFGRAHIYLDSGADDQELQTPVANEGNKLLKGKVGRSFLKRLQTVEAVWTYPTTYNALNPLRADWYNPQVWYVMGKQIHRSRLPTFIGRPLPDLLKPAYSFGGLSLSQMAKPYVDIWLKTRAAVGELIHAFSVMVLKTDLSTILQPGHAGGLQARAALFNAFRDNAGLMIVNNATEDFANVSAPLGGLHELQAASQEHMMTVARIPATKFTGLQPSGLNTTSEGEMRAFNDTIKAYQHKLFKPNLDYIIDIAMISLWGKPDPDIRYEFESLVELTDKEKAEQRKLKAETGQIHIDSGVIAPEEERARIIADPDSEYDGLDPDDVPDLQQEEEEGLEPKGGHPQEHGGTGEPEGGAQAEDNVLPFGLDAGWNEADHPRGQPGNAGQFGSGGGSSGGGAKNAPAAKPAAGGALPAGGLKRVGKQMGSNPGGVFETPSGERYYIKAGHSKEHVKTELAAVALARLAGARTLNYQPVEGGDHIASKMATLDKKNVKDLSPDERREAQRDFVTQAWLANWDAVGLGGDNIGTVNGKATSLDFGGALTYRAQGAPKGPAFGDKVGELATLRNKSMNPDAAGLYGPMAIGQIRESANRVLAIPDEKIRKTIEENGLPSSLADKLIARKADIKRQTDAMGGDGPPEKATSTVVFAPGLPPIKELNGVPFKAWKPPEDWSDVEGQIELPEDAEEIDVPEGKALSSGVLIREPDGRIWVMRPSGGYGGYEATFPKGRAEPDLSLQANAIKEAYEETGLKVNVVGFAGDYEGDTTLTRYYIAERTGGDPLDHGWETGSVVLAPPNKLGSFLNRSRDRKIAKAHLGGDEAPFEESKHPRAPDGKFSSGGGGGGGAAPEPEKPTFKSKKEHVAHLLQKGTTAAEILAATGWPSVSVPQQAKVAGLKIEKYKEGGVTKYKGIPLTDAEKAELKAAHKEAKAAAPEPPPEPAPAPPEKPAPKFPPPTEAEIQKAKKNTPILKNMFHPSMTAELEKFDEKYAGKNITDPEKLAEKVNEFKTLKAKSDGLQAASAAEQAAATKKAQEEAAAKQKQAAAAAKAKAEAEKAKHAAEMKELMTQLDITSEEDAEAFHGLAQMLGGTSQSAINSVQAYEKEAKNKGFPISGFEYAMIKSYTGSHYTDVNKKLRAGAMTKEQYLYAKVVNKALKKMPPYPGETQRGAHLTTEQQQAYAQVGSVVQERAFMSTSKGGGFSGNVKYHVQGKSGRDIQELSNHNSEAEVLYPANTPFLITKVEGKPGGQMTVWMKEVEPW